MLGPISSCRPVRCAADKRLVCRAARSCGVMVKAVTDDAAHTKRAAVAEARRVRWPGIPSVLQQTARGGRCSRKPVARQTVAQRNDPERSGPATKCGSFLQQRLLAAPFLPAPSLPAATRLVRSATVASVLKPAESRRVTGTPMNRVLGVFTNRCTAQKSWIRPVNTVLSTMIFPPHCPLRLPHDSTLHEPHSRPAARVCFG